MTPQLVGDEIQQMAPQNNLYQHQLYQPQELLGEEENRHNAEQSRHYHELIEQERSF